MINARAQNAYGVAHFAQQNHVPQVRWENVDIIGDFIKNQMAKKQLEMMDKNYELAKDQAAFAREKFGYDQERDKVKDGQWQKEFDYKVIEADKNRKHDFDLEAVRGRNNLAAINARENTYRSAENRELQNLIDIFTIDAQAQAERLNNSQKQVQKFYYDDDYATGNILAEGLNASRSKFKNIFGLDAEKLNEILKDPMLTAKYAKYYASQKVNPHKVER